MIDLRRRRHAFYLFLAGVVVIGIAACGGSSKSSQTSSDTNGHSTSTTTTKAKPAQASLTQQLKAQVKGSKPGTSATVKAGQPFLVLTKVPSQDLMKNVRVKIIRTAPTVFTVTSTVVGTPATATGQVTVSSPNEQIVALNYACQLPPRTFCPGRVVHSSPTQLTVGFHHPQIPIAMSVTVGAPGSVKAQRLQPLGPPAPGSAVTATIVVTSAAKKGKPAKPSSSTTLAPGGRIIALVRAASNTAAGATLRIAIPHTSGNSITIGAGGAPGSPSASATAKSSGGTMRIAGMQYACRLPPYTFCPVTTTVTSTGLDLTMPAPQVPVALVFTTASG
jgi:hypothetical protein